MNKTLIQKKLLQYFDKELISQINLRTINDDKDLISSIFEQIHDKETRKKYAQFFTHKELVEFILSHIPIKENNTILDPACGAGAFIIEAIDKVGINNVYGIDIDKKALDLCDINVAYKYDHKCQNLKHANTLKSTLLSLFPKIAKNGGFDIIVGNPPFQNLLKGIDYDQKDLIYSNVLSRIANSATLMVAKGYEYLKQGGYLGFVLPKNIFRVDSFKVLRDFLLDNTKIISIYDLDHYFKDVRGDQIILIFQKKRLTLKDIKTNKVKIYVFKKSNPFLKPYNYEIPQNLFKKYSFFPVFYHKDVFSLADKLLNFPTTLDKVCSGQIFRGIGLSTSSNLISTQKKKNYSLVYRGDSIKRFGIKYPLFIDNNKLSLLPINRVKRLQQNKIILQNLCSKEGGIFATLSGSKELTLDTVTNVIPANISLKYILGVLNSDIANFFIILVIFLNSNFTMHTDREYIGKIPIVVPNKAQEDKVSTIVDSLIEMSDKYSREFFLLYSKLNKALYEIYNLSSTETDTIERLLREVMSKKHYGTTNE